MRAGCQIVHETLVEALHALSLRVLVPLLERVVRFHLLLLRLPFALSAMHGLLTGEHDATLLLDRFVELFEKFLKVLPAGAVHIAVNRAAKALPVILAVVEERIQFRFGLRSLGIE